MSEVDIIEDRRPTSADDRLRFGLSASKLRPPPLRRGSVLRPSLIDRLEQDDSCSIISLQAPPGYGKTTLLSQWAERSASAFAWVTVDDRDNDPKALLSYVARALDGVEPVGARVFNALASPASSVPGSVLPRLGAAFGSMTVPIVLVLDDVHLLRTRESRDALSVLADQVPAGSRLVLSGRTAPPLRAARLRAEGRLLEIGTTDLSLTEPEASLLLREAGVSLAVDEVADLQRRTEGWAAGLYLASLYLREGGSIGAAGASFSGDDRLVSEYIETELLARISERQRDFLSRSAVLERMSGSLCESVLDLPGSAATLAELAESNLLLLPLDRQGRWYRYHHLFRDMLVARLERLEPGLKPLLLRRAAAWSAENGLPAEALQYAMAAGDVDAAADLVAQLAVPERRRGRMATLEWWFRWLDERGAIDTHPMVTVLAGLIYAWMGRPLEAERWAEVVDVWRQQETSRLDPPVGGWAALLRAFMCRRGVEQMLQDADEAARLLAARGVVTPGPALLQGIAHILTGDPQRGDVSLEEAVTKGESTDAHEVVAAALSERSLLAVAAGEWMEARVLSEQAGGVLARAGIDASYVTPLVCAVRARTSFHHGDIATARGHLVNAQRLRPLQTYGIPHVAVQTLLQLAHTHLALADVAGARTLMREADQILKRRPQLGTLVGEAAALRARLSADPTRKAPGASTLTTAELRVLPMLATHLSLKEIGAEMFLSRDTIKSQVASIYRKVGASTRSEAVIRSRELGLLEG